MRNLIKQMYLTIMTMKHGDKVAHAIGSGLAFLVLYMLLGPVLAWVLVMTGGSAKEVWDHFNPPHQADVYDLVADAGGALAVFIVLRVLGV